MSNVDLLLICLASKTQLCFCSLNSNLGDNNNNNNKNSSSHFTCKRHVVLKNQPYGKSQSSLKIYCRSAANKGWSMVNYCQSLAFARPYLSYNDHCNRWLFREIFYYYFYVLEIFLNDLELFSLELLNIQLSAFYSVLENRCLS